MAGRSLSPFLAMNDVQQAANPASVVAASHHGGSLSTMQQHALTSALIQHMQQQQLQQQQQQLLRQLQLQQQSHAPPQLAGIEYPQPVGVSLQLFPSVPPACPGNDVELPRGGVSARAAEPDLRLSVGLSLGGGGAAAVEDGAKKPAKRKRADELPRAQTPESSGENSNLDTAAPPPPPAAPRPLFAFPPGGAPSASPQWLATVPPGNTARAAARRTHQSFHHGCGAVLPATPSPDDVPGGGWMGAGDGRVPVGVGSPVEGRAGGLSGTGSAGGSGGEQEEGLDAQEAGGKSSRPRTVAERKRRNGISEFGLLKGTTYNSFLIRGANKVALIDASHEKFRELYLSALKAEIDIKDIDYVIANHTEPDHSGLIRDLIELNPNITVVGSKVCIQFLQNLVLKPFKSLVAQPGKILDLGGGHELDFIMAPNLHWPDTMFTFDKGTGVMFTCDAFGSHYCSEK
ncbi:unnamed protein product, partial [Closterium sp. NIES-53]